MLPLIRCAFFALLSAVLDGEGAFLMLEWFDAVVRVVRTPAVEPVILMECAK